MVLFECNDDFVIQYCDPDFENCFQAHASELQLTDQAAANLEWTALEDRAVDLALMAPLFNAGGDFVSARVGNYQLGPFGWDLFDQMWVQ